jgi:hypothetical protein
MEKIQIPIAYICFMMKYDHKKLNVLAKFL